MKHIFVASLLKIIFLRIELKNIASIQTGFYAKPSKEGDVIYLQAKHFNEKGLLINDLHPDLLSENVSEKHLLNPGDIVFAAKGVKNFAAVFQEHNAAAVASTSFFVIRLTVDYVLSEYLSWFLNHPNTLVILKSKARGTSIASISKSVLEETAIIVPDLETQKKVLKINELRVLENKLKEQIESLKEKQIQQQIINVLK